MSRREYSLKEIGDQVHRLTLQMETEKIVTATILRRMQNHGMVTAESFSEILDRTPQGTDEESQLLADIWHSRMLQISELLSAPNKSAG